ncbi:hypothetical protein Q8A67_020341 [Cirrhinus molitorella]|uniref:Uncharacterized protein n=1 Tax=Cirrhinus molitorella TaxID=172907 RepID=A0AA88TFA7_9TELE|nr:hypothetical protein Q8A67_020341 [Cirrhinus molitorella]
MKNTTSTAFQKLQKLPTCFPEDKSINLKGLSTRCSDVIRSAAEVSWPLLAVFPAAELCQADSNKTLREVSGELVKVSRAAVWVSSKRHEGGGSCCILLQSAGTQDSKTAATDNRRDIQEELPVNLHLLSAEEAQLL